jgi:hypothetical protein
MVGTFMPSTESSPRGGVSSTRRAPLRTSGSMSRLLLRRVVCVPPPIRGFYRRLSLRSSVAKMPWFPILLAVAPALLPLRQRVACALALVATTSCPATCSSASWKRLAWRLLLRTRSLLCRCRFACGWHSVAFEEEVRARYRRRLSKLQAPAEPRYDRWRAGGSLHGRNLNGSTSPSSRSCIRCELIHAVAGYVITSVALALLR